MTMKKIFIFLAAAFCLASAIGQEKAESMLYVKDHIYVKSQINGKNATLVFDTGSPYTCIDSIFLALSNLQYKNVGKATMGGAGKNVEKVRIIIDELTYTVLGKKYKSKISPVIKLKPIVGDLADGILGIDNMGDKVISIDYVGEQISFNDRLGDTTGHTSIPIRYHKNRIYVPLSVTVRDGLTIEGEGLLDIGSGSSVSFTSAVAKQYGLQDVSPQVSYYQAIGGIGGDASGSDFRAKSVTIGGIKLNDVTMDYSHNASGALSSMDYIALIGNEFLEHFDIIIDLVGKRIFIKPNAKFDKPFESPVVGFGYTDRSRTLGCWVVNGLYANSNAEKAGLRSGDHIVAFNGRSVKDIDIEKTRDVFDGLNAVTLTVQRDDTQLEISFNFDEPKI